MLRSPVAARRLRPQRTKCLSFPSSNLLRPTASNPAAPLEVEIRPDGAREHQPERDRVAIMPAELREIMEVHSVDSCDKRRRQEHDGRPGKQLHRRILLDADEAERSIEQEL